MNETMNKYEAEVYTDTSFAYVYAIYEDKVVWGAVHHRELLEGAVEDLLALVAGRDPIDERWEHGLAEGESDTAWADEIRYSDKAEAPRMVASTYCYDGSPKSLLELNLNGYPADECLAEMLLGPDWFEEY